MRSTAAVIAQNVNTRTRRCTRAVVQSKLQRKPRSIIQASARGVVYRLAERRRAIDNIFDGEPACHVSTAIRASEAAHKASQAAWREEGF